MAEEEPQPSTPVTVNTKMEEDVAAVEDEEFYEKIEAPKFVDFTVPDPYCPDDRYWFCLRVGCDRKHEEEIDHEAISKDFVLRVMAARSPYMRLQKVLNRKPYSVKDQCPFTAPAKPSKSRLAMISSMSKKMFEPSKPLSISTPQAKTKQVAAKYLTTPRNRKPSPNPNSFRSVQNPKPTTIAVPKNRMVAKALVFHSPKKKVVISIKTSSELRTPLSNICEGMKRLEIGSQKKRELLSSTNPRKDIRDDSSKRQLSAACKEKKLVRPPTRKGQESKLTKERKPKKVMVEEDSSDTEIDARSRDGSVLGGAVRKKVTFLVGEEEKDTSRGEMELPNCEDRCLKEIASTKIQKKLEESREALQEITEASLEKREGPEESRNLAVEESDDKENVFGPETNRNVDDTLDNSNHSERGKQVKNKTTKMVVGLSDRNLKQGLNLAAAGAHGVKFNKPKPTTNPKPFRLRTDERRILKEANLERRMQSQLFQKEASTASVLPNRVLKRRQANGGQGEKHSIKPTENSTRKIKSPLIQGQQSTKLKGVASRKVAASGLASGKHLGVVHETLHGDPGLVKKVGASSGSTSLSRGKRETMLSKEPHFHGV